MDTVCSINNLARCLVEGGFSPDLANFLTLLGGVVLVATIPLVTVIFLIWIERKVAARVQDRLGPNRVGPVGLLQTVADALKMLTKEDITPTGADKFIYNLAPVIAFATVILMWAVVPFTPLHIGADVGIGVLYFMAVASIGTVKIMVAGWSSNNKYALLGAFRTIAQLLSYEVPLVLSLLIPVMLAGTMSLQGITEAQGGMWYLFIAPVAAFLFYVANLAETGRAPFDLLEAESEIIAGYNIEYSGFKWGMFMASEFLHAFTAALFFAIIFMGGWWGPFVQEVPLLGVLYLVGKTAIVYVFGLVLRATVPRVRIDQLMALNWKFLVPLAIANVLVIAFLIQVLKALGLLPAPGADIIAHLPMTVVMLLGNLAIIAVAMQVLRNQGREEKMAQDARLAARQQRVIQEVRTPAGAPVGD